MHRTRFAEREDQLAKESLGNWNYWPHLNESQANGEGPEVSQLTGA
jgi:hypothetical protein